MRLAWLCLVLVLSLAACSGDGAQGSEGAPFGTDLGPASAPESGGAQQGASSGDTTDESGGVDALPGSNGSAGADAGAGPGGDTGGSGDTGSSGGDGMSSGADSTGSSDPSSGGSSGQTTGGASGQTTGGASGQATGSSSGQATGGASGQTTGGASGQTTGSTGNATDPSIDPNDPPTPAAACGELQAHNGRVIPDFGAVSSAGAIDFDPIGAGPSRTVSEDKTLKNPAPQRNDYSVTAYAPSRDGATVESGPFPFLVLLPGFSGNHTVYSHFIDRFVSFGVAVLGVTPANVAFTDAPNNPANVNEILNAVDWALTDSLLTGKIDETRMATAGHSQGGKLAFYTAVEDSRFDLVIGWDPQNGGGAPCFIAGLVGQDCNAWPIAPSCDADRSFESSGRLSELRAEVLVFAARDTNVTPDQHLWAENFYRGAPSPAHLVLFPSAGHGDWAGTGATTDITKRVQMALVLSRFFGMTGAETYLPGGSYLSSETSVGTATSK